MLVPSGYNFKNLMQVKNNEYANISLMKTKNGPYEIKAP